VNITNNNTGDYVVVTSNINGIYACGLNASNGDILFGNCTAGLGVSGHNQTVANLSNVTQWLNITVTSPVWPDFSWEPEEPVVDEDVNFTDESDGDISSWSWNFGDGYTSTFRNPVHSFSKAKDYIVTLTVSDGNNTRIVSKTITISEPSEEPIVTPVVSAFNYLWFVVLGLGIVAVILIVYIFGFARKKKKPT
ncbi:PKD domain-containing protein, partial [bacterium]|nr:PKD domain-containing protein [bacterium]